MPKIFTRKRDLIVTGAIIVLGILFLFSPRLLRSVRGFTVKVITAPISAVNSVRLYFVSREELEYENSLLMQKLGELSLEIERNRSLSDENSRLRALLGFKDTAGYETISAEVVARDPNNWLGSFTINKGGGHGIKRGAAVCSANGLVGKIVEVDEYTSSVMLVTHPAFKAGGMLKSSRVHGVVEGDGRGYARMLYLPLDAEVPEGEPVLTSGYSREFPKGIIIGHIISVEKSKTGLFKTAVIEPAATAYDQEEVLCLK